MLIVSQYVENSKCVIQCVKVQGERQKYMWSSREDELSQSPGTQSKSTQEMMVKCDQEEYENHGTNSGNERKQEARYRLPSDLSYKHQEGRAGKQQASTRHRMQQQEARAMLPLRYEVDVNVVVRLNILWHSSALSAINI